MREIVLMRHGEASMNAESDEARPLTEAGRAGVSQVAKRYFEASTSRLPLICASPLVRAQQTAALLVAEAGGDVNQQIWQEARPEASLESLIARLKAAPERLLLVTHQPLISNAVEYLTGERPLIAPATLLVINAETIAPDWGSLECVIST